MRLLGSIRHLMTTQPLSYVPMLAPALVVTLAAIVIEQFKPGVDPAVTDTADCYRAVVLENRTDDAAQRPIVELADGRRVQLYFASWSPELKCGYIVEFSAKLQPVMSTVEPYAFDYANYLRRKGVALSAYVAANGVKVVAEKRTLMSRVRNFSSHMALLLDRSSLNDATIVFLKAALLGDASEARVTVGNIFSASGLAHLLAVSGTHVAILTGVLTVLLFPLYLLRFRRLLMACVLLLLWGYALLTGMAPSVVRAVVMACCFGLSFILQRTNAPMNAWLLAWTILLACDTGNLYNVGFQMSFAATGAILLIMPRINELMRGSHKVLNLSVGALAMSITAMAGSGIIAAYHYHTFPLLFVFANLPVGLLLPWLLGGGVMLCALLWLGFDATWLCELLNILYGAVDWIAQTTAHVNGGQWRHLWFSAWVMVPYFATLLVLAYSIWRRSSGRAWVGTVFAAGVTVVTVWATTPEAAAEEWFVTTAGGNTALVHSRGDQVCYISLLRGQLQENARRSCERTLANYLSKRGTDTLVMRTDCAATIGKHHILFLSDSVAMPANAKVDYLIVTRSYRGQIKTIIDGLKPDTVLLAPELHWRRRQQWVDSLDKVSVPYIWLRNHRFGVREITW
ncbi:MAG: ComEC family competence protein [Muribaculum sp.]|nr:ComEC family competence protein [Muribaculaceae bacterium]MCM1080429.1 ComEC family competence protein [Muribaculum sp.]